MAGSASTGYGLVLTGEFRSVREGRTFQGREGPQTPGELRLLVDDEMYVVQYPTVSEARQAAGDTAEGAPLALRVTPRLAGNREARRDAWVEWRGARA
jgi:hypothetical protein